MTLVRTFSLRRLSLPLLGLALLTLLASASTPAPAAAQTLLPRKFTVMVTFDSVEFPKLDDCPQFPTGPFSFCNSADLYGTLQAKSSSQPLGSGVRNLATWGNTAGCFGFWNDNLSQEIACAKTVRDDTGELSPWGGPFNLSETGLCPSTSFDHCDGPHTLNNNSILVTMKAGDTLTVGATLVDDDTLTGDDTVCDVSVPVGPFTGAQLSTLNLPGQIMARGFDGDGSCTIHFSVKRVA
jgi:hypothetical protein